MLKIIKKIGIWPLLLAVIAIVLCIVNYSSNTWLSGWDTLHPEFNFLLYFKRIFFSVWQEHQGLGALATQAHASEIPRMFILYPLSLLLPENLLRYGYFFLTLIVGPLGMFYFLHYVIFKSAKENTRNLASFAGGLFYLLNLGTLQQFYLPLEMFATHFATLPLLALFAFKILHEGGKKNYIIFVLLTFFNASIAHTPTLFYAYFLGLTVFVFGYLIQRKNLWKKCLAILGLTIIINCFWLLPHLYFVFTSGNIVQDSKISLMFSQTAISTGQKFGNFKDTLFLKNYLFEWGKYDNDSNQFVKLFGEWNPHLAKLGVIIVQYVLSGMVLIGLFLSIKNKRNQGLPVLGIFLISFLLIANDAPVLSNLYELLQKNIPLFKEALRFPYTKFSILLVFSQAVFFSVFWEKFVEKLLIVFKKNKEKEIIFDLAILIMAMLIYFTLPAFKGNLINQDMKVKFPPEYFSAMEYLNNQENGRIALLPIHQYWGWIYHNWDYEGAGFEWFGLKDPLLDREFDRWNPNNEQFYWEASYAVYSKNLFLLENVLEKYQIRWLVVDGSTINPSSSKTLFDDEVKEIFSKSKKISFIQTFGKIKIYKINLETQVKNFVYLENDLPVVNDYQWGNEDKGYEEFGNYISISNEPLIAYYPYRSLFTGRKTDEIEVGIKDFGDRFVFEKTLPENVKKYTLVFPWYKGEELVEIDKNDFSQAKYPIPTAEILEGKIMVTVPKVKGLFSAEIDSTKIENALKEKNCNQFGKGTVKNVNKGEKIELEAIDANNCSASFYLPDLSHKFAYLISAQTKNIFGKPLLFWLENLTNRKADMELYLDENATSYNLNPTSYIIQPPMSFDGLGYTLHFDNISIGREQTINELGKITVNPIPYEFLTKIKLVASSKQQAVRETGSTSILEVKHPNPAVYEIKIDQQITDSSTLVLSQAYHEGWKAYEVDSSKQQVVSNIGFLAPVFGKEIKDHVQVNNWENGWNLLTDSYRLQATSYVLIFMPQYLEFLGFLLLVSCFLFVIFAVK